MPNPILRPLRSERAFAASPSRLNDRVGFSFSFRGASYMTLALSARVDLDEVSGASGDLGPPYPYLPYCLKGVFSAGRKNLMLFSWYSQICLAYSVSKRAREKEVLKCTQTL